MRAAIVAASRAARGLTFQILLMTYTWRLLLGDGDATAL
jgi:hypothetical protein